MRGRTESSVEVERDVVHDARSALAFSASDFTSSRNSRAAAVNAPLAFMQSYERWEAAS